MADKVPETPLKPRVGTPGPGAYKPEESYQKTYARAYTFGIRPDSMLKEPVPQLDPNATQAEKIKNQRMQPNPGPGAYDPSLESTKGDMFACSSFGRDIKAATLAETKKPARDDSGPGPKYYPTVSYKYSHNTRDVIIQPKYKEDKGIKKENLSAASYFPQVRLDQRGKVIQQPYKEKPNTVVKTNDPSSANYFPDWHKIHPGNHADKVIQPDYRPPAERKQNFVTPGPAAYDVQVSRNKQGARIGIRYNNRVNTF